MRAGSALEADRVVADHLALQGQRSGNVRLASTEGFAVDFCPAHRAVPAAVSETCSVARERRRRSDSRISDGDADIRHRLSRTPVKGIKVEYRQPAPVVAVMRCGHR